MLEQEYVTILTSRGSPVCHYVGHRDRSMTSPKRGVNNRSEATLFQGTQPPQAQGDGESFGRLMANIENACLLACWP